MPTSTIPGAIAPVPRSFLATQPPSSRKGSTHRFHAACATVLALSFLAGTVPSQEPTLTVGPPLYRLHGQAYSRVGYGASLFGLSLAKLGDLDGDGYDDFAAGAPYDGEAYPGVLYRAGSVSAISGRTGARLWTSDLGGTLWDLGWSVAAAGDVDGDHVVDVIAGTRSGAGGFGLVRVFSGTDGRLVHQINGSSHGAGIGQGSAVSAAGDVDGDGRDDFAIGFPDRAGSANGFVLVISGRDGMTELRRYTGSVPPPGSGFGDRFGWSVDLAGDVDGDGMEDLVVGAPNTLVQGVPVGAVYVFSGATGLPLGTFFGDAIAIGDVVRGVGDVNGDGRDEVIAASSYYRVFDVLSDAILDEGPGANNVAAAGDVNGDGFDDFLISSTSTTRTQTTVIGGGSFTPLRVVTTPATYPYQHYGLVGGCNLDGDGFDDFLIWEFSAEGRVAAYSGRPDATRLHRWDGAAAGDGLGGAVAFAGDIDADGFDDVVLGSPGSDGPNSTRPDTGMAEVRSGRDGRVLRAWYGDASEDEFGGSVAAAGDVDGDGHADVVVGARLGDGPTIADSGYARVFSGRTGLEIHTLRGLAAGDRFGGSVAAAGDVDGDGFDDVVVGAAGDDRGGPDSGSATVFSGRTGTVIHTWYGDAPGDALGGAVGGAEDVDGDGVPDLIVGAVGADTTAGMNAGMARLYSGDDGSTIYTWFGDAADSAFGASVDGAGDVDADGRCEVIVGQPRVTSPNGRQFGGAAHVFRGDGSTMSTLHAPASDIDSQLFGCSVAGAGDVDGDGHDDVVVGARGSNHSTGTLAVYSGADGELLLREFLGGGGGDEFGAAVAGAGDVDGNGLSDVLAGARGDDDQGAEAGAAFVFGLDYTTAGVVRPGWTRSYGQACPGSDQRLPHAGSAGRATVGQMFRITLRGAPLATLPLCPILLGNRRPPLPLAAYGFGSCSLLVDRIVDDARFADAAGHAAFDIAIPNTPSLFGVVVSAQWAVIESAPLFVSFSDALTTTVGR